AHSSKKGATGRIGPVSPSRSTILAGVTGETLPSLSTWSVTLGSMIVPGASCSSERSDQRKLSAGVRLLPQRAIAIGGRKKTSSSRSMVFSMSIALAHEVFDFGLQQRPQVLQDLRMRVPLGQIGINRVARLADDRLRMPEEIVRVVLALDRTEA